MSTNSTISWIIKSGFTLSVFTVFPASYFVKYTAAFNLAISL